MDAGGEPDVDEVVDSARRARLRRSLIIRRERLNQREKASSQVRSASGPSFAYPAPDEPVIPSMQPQKTARQLRNRESAQRSREKKRRHQENLESESDELSTFIQQVTHENDVLKGEIRRNIEPEVDDSPSAHSGSTDED